MFGKSLAGMFEDAVRKTPEQAATETKRITELAKQIASHPVKILAAFISAPFLLISVAINVKSPLRRFLAVAGIAIALLAAYGAGTLLGTLTAAYFIGTQVGAFMGLAFLIGTGTTVFLTVFFQILTLNFFCFIFLKMNTREVLDYLNKLSSG